MEAFRNDETWTRTRDWLNGLVGLACRMFTSPPRVVADRIASRIETSGGALALLLRRDALVALAVHCLQIARIICSTICFPRDVIHFVRCGQPYLSASAAVALTEIAISLQNEQAHPSPVSAVASFG